MSDDTIQAGSGAAAESASTLDETQPPTARHSLDFGEATLALVPVNRIRVANPRSRNRKKHQLIVENIARLGLKKPITVAIAKGSDPDDPSYNLVCGQGRLEAFKILGEDTIPAIIIDATLEDQLVMGLAENIARRRPTTFEEVRNIAAMLDRGYEVKEIAQKVDLTVEYINAILKLWTRGEELLLDAVEKGRIPVSVAVMIADADDKEIQLTLLEEYITSNMRGKKLIWIKHLLEQRRDFGKGLRSGLRRSGDRSSAKDFVRSYQQVAERQHLFVKKASLCEDRLGFVVGAMRKLLDDENFINVLRAEKMESLPRCLTERLGPLP